MRDVSIITALFLFLAISPSSARTWHVPAEVSTISAAIDSAEAGDEIVIACGTYSENGMYLKSGVTIRSESGLPDCVTIDATGLDWTDNIFECWSTTDIRLEGLTLSGGLALSHYYGFNGGALVIAGIGFEMNDCVITGNESYRGGGVSLFGNASAIFRRCVISANTAQSLGGGIELYSGAVLNAYECTIIDNSAVNGPDGWLDSGSLAVLHCCTTDLKQWGGTGELQIVDEGCDVRSETRTWGAVKALFR